MNWEKQMSHCDLRVLSGEKSKGFTLIEVLIVTFILAAMIGLVALRLSRDDRDFVRDEADRFVVLLQAAREETILQGSLLAVEVSADSYRFLRVGEKGKFVPIEEGVLGPRRLPPLMSARLELEGQSTEGAQGIVLDPSGALPVFNLAFVLNQTTWWVTGKQDGKVRSLPTLDARTS